MFILNVNAAILYMHVFELYKEKELVLTDWDHPPSPHVTSQLLNIQTALFFLVQHQISPPHVPPKAVQIPIS